MTEDGEEVACDFEPGLLFLSGKVVPVNICLRGDVCSVQDVEISGDGFGMAACSSVHDVDGLVFGLHPRSDTGMCSGGPCVRKGSGYRIRDVFDDGEVFSGSRKVEHESMLNLFCGRGVFLRNAGVVAVERRGRDLPGTKWRDGREGGRFSEVGAL